MGFRSILRAIRNLWSGSGQFPTAGLRSPEEIRRIMELEQARADRSGEFVSVAAFVPGSSESSEETLDCLIQVLRTGMRKTDEIGWLDRTEVCVVMPNTGRTGAQRAVEKIYERLPQHCPRPGHRL